MRLLAALCLTLLMLAALPARADIYGYVDAEGIAHFSTEKIDARYQLYLRGTTSFDTSQPGASVASAERIETPLSAYLSGHPGLKKVETLVHDAAQEFSLDPALLKAVMAAESGFNTYAVSPKGAIGLMQIMPATAERYGMQGDRKRSIAQKLTDPKTNIRLAARYLRDLHKLFPSRPELVIASYNAGEGAVQKYNNAIPPYPETRNYVQIVKQFYLMYKPAAQTLAIASASLAGEMSGAKRIHMTIPGRRNMPASALE
ncbi:lytic transglycosylase domain-containing protein [Noviherbaspirillum sp. Root189]|uniref:lytic transglycosylase domain-containing protein n=1 Tax=Noviherbaspirillum sp. Root189 TaxID=1736487 RepID=UPI000710F94E|nr:lytic transglycosylase domain-containing protein [Noviherbaspirillum sp. Root189]KRB89082.1 lytic transglycosylase [Noviherbaspirillum sp. Root189]